MQGERVEACAADGGLGLQLSSLPLKIQYLLPAENLLASFSFSFHFFPLLEFLRKGAPRSTNFRLIFPPCTTNELDVLNDLGSLAPSLSCDIFLDVA